MVSFRKKSGRRSGVSTGRNPVIYKRIFPIPAVNVSDRLPKRAQGAAIEPHKRHQTSGYHDLDDDQRPQNAFPDFGTAES